MQTSQEVLARKELERVTTLVPGEPAGFANLGLLLMRQQELDAAAPLLGKAAELAPTSAAIARLQALLESRKGRPAESTAHWRRAAQLDPLDAKAPYALALEIERQGGDLAEAQRVLQGLVARNENLAARLELARLSAKRGDAAGLAQAIAPLAALAPSWPDAAQEHWRALAEAPSPAAAGPRVSFLKNVLLRTPEFRRALAAVSTPRDEVGEPLVRFVLLPNPKPQPAPADTGLRFALAPVEGSHDAGTAIAFWPGAGAAAEVLVATTAGVRLPGGATLAIPAGRKAKPARPPAVVAADFDYDYRTDLLLAGENGLAMFGQGDGGVFADVTARAKLARGITEGRYLGGWAADLDTDGDLDALLGAAEGPPILLRNNGDGTFAVQQPFPGARAALGFAWSDLDGDGVPDAAVLQADGAPRVFLNLRGGVFRETALPSGLGPFIAIAAADAGDEAVFGVLAAAPDGSVVRLTAAAAAGPGGWRRTDLGRVPGGPPSARAGTARLLVGDLDNNAAFDLVLAGGSASQVMLGSADGFVALPAGLDLSVAGLADLDGDGRLDLLGSGREGNAARAKNEGTKAYKWQTVRPQSATATGDQRINSFGIGGEVEVRSGLHLQRRVIDTPVVHFGLGDAAQADVVRVIWPNGIIQSEFGALASTEVKATQRLKGSCPWLFAWNGREMGFVTDLIWRSPLGLRINAQKTADVLMTEDWVKVRGDQLVPRDGAYDLRVTAELWETHFFDLVSLLVVDHPAGTEVFVDERFAVPAPRLEAVATGPLQPLAAARDHTGADVLETVTARDDRHLDTAGRGTHQGITRDHFVEVELPEGAPRTGPLWLVAQGWVHPTDSSVNVALGQGAHPAPRGLSLHVADASGRFRKVRDGIGFPSGKDKTVLVDLAGAFPGKGRRIARLATNLEIFWDRVAWAEGRPGVRLSPQRLALGSAELLPRGYSVTEQKDASTPERPRYVLAGTTPRWLDLEGYHTRFGDVLPLLAGVDDRYVIMNAGDEMRLRFPAPPGPAEGTVRDFVVIGDGWVKDGDYNTTFSRTVLPLPTHANGRYEPAPGALEDDLVYRSHPGDFAEFHTRYVSPERVRGALGPK